MQNFPSGSAVKLGSLTSEGAQSLTLTYSVSES